MGSQWVDGQVCGKMYSKYFMVESKNSKFGSSV